MNFVNRLLGQSSGTVDRSHSSGDMSLGLTHLKKLFADFRSPPPNCTQKMLEDKLYNMLPLFCRVCIYVYVSFNINRKSLLFI